MVAVSLYVEAYASIKLSLFARDSLKNDEEIPSVSASIYELQTAINWASGFTLGVVRDGQALPLHPGVEHPENEVEDTIIA